MDYLGMFILVFWGFFLGWQVCYYYAKKVFKAYEREKELLREKCEEQEYCYKSLIESLQADLEWERTCHDYDY